MEKNYILTADILDIIFDGRNKLYGAYDLRKSYNRRLSRAICFTVILVLFAFLGTVFSRMSAKKGWEKISVSDVRLGRVEKRDIPLLAPPPPPPPAPPPLVELNQVKFTTPVIVKDNAVKKDEIIEEIAEDRAIGSRTIESENKSHIIQAPVEEIGNGILEIPKVKEEDLPFRKVEIEAQFPGGQQAWARYLQKNLDANAPVEQAAPAGNYQVIVQFIVSKDGSISDVQAETRHGYGMEEEAVKIIQRGPKWSPAIQNGRPVNAYRRQPVTFVVEEQ